MLRTCGAAQGLVIVFSWLSPGLYHEKFFVLALGKTFKASILISWHQKTAVERVLVNGVI